MVWDIVAGMENIEMYQSPVPMTGVVVAVVHRAVVGVNLDRNLNFAHALGDKVIDLWKYLTAAESYMLVMVPIADYRVSAVAPILVGHRMADVVVAAEDAVAAAEAAAAVAVILAAVAAAEGHNYSNIDVEAAAVVVDAIEVMSLTLA